MKNKQKKAKLKPLQRDEMQKICGGAGSEPVIMVIDGKTVIIWP